jgi:tight adherence protein B
MNDVTVLVLSFLGVFAAILLAVSMAWSFLEAQRKKKVAGMLETVAGKEPAAQTTVLKSIDDAKRDFLTTLLERLNAAGAVQAHIQQAGLDWTLGKLVLFTLAGAAAGALLGWKLKVLILPSLSAAALALLFGAAPYLMVLRKRTKRLGLFEEQFPEALDFLARAMRAGHAFSVSLEMLAEESPDPLAREFRQVFNEQNLGAPVEVALQNLAKRIPLLDVSFFVSAVMLQKETGGNLSEILNKLSYVIRERFKLKGQVRAASAHGRITGMILTVMPVVLVFALLAVAPGYLQGMVKDPDGKWLVIGAICGQVVGYLFIRRIINIKV